MRCSSSVSIAHGLAATLLILAPSTAFAANDCGLSEVVAFFDASRANGSLTGAGPGNSAPGRLGAMRNVLVAAEEDLATGDVQGTVEQLKDALAHTDGQPRPPDFTAGPAAPELACYLQAVINCLTGTSPPACLAANQPPETQVTNNAGDPLYEVDVGGVAFSQNLSPTPDGNGGFICQTPSYGCSTGFDPVPVGTDPVTLLLSAGGVPISLGSLGPFLDGNNYSVTIRKVNGAYCADLWQRLNASPTFCADTTRILIQSNCGASGSGCP